MALTKEEVFPSFLQLAKGDETVAKTVLDYVSLPYGSVSTTTLYLAVEKVHGKDFAKKLSDVLEEIKCPRKKQIL